MISCFKLYHRNINGKLLWKYIYSALKEKLDDLWHPNGVVHSMWFHQCCSHYIVLMCVCLFVCLFVWKFECINCNRLNCECNFWNIHKCFNVALWPLSIFCFGKLVQTILKAFSNRKTKNNRHYECQIIYTISRVFIHPNLLWQKERTNKQTNEKAASCCSDSDELNLKKRNKKILIKQTAALKPNISFTICGVLPQRRLW